ncbi:hypothetical protein FGW37_25770 [Streptomyces rectiverticillatus]|uniref:hypothetical protein n=1 Tax=Streptomyces rectiverticillatus TaxID=173860 RepID=UPI0015C2FAF2|nr:hypothetical protein [Streptomyces rectiverticillatus]QLE74553.1 hypothetical protein FGW37_25770 [Streptomyces rectiverticillatus]
MSEPEEACPGPHAFCKGCRGSGDYHAAVLYLNQPGRGGHMTGAHLCPYCTGRGFFCKHRPRCSGLHDDDTPVIGPDVLPPV